MKVEKQQEAIKMRTEQGESISVIAQKLGVSKGSVSRWCSNIELTEAQKMKLQERNPIFNRQFNGAQSAKKKAIERKKTNQEIGRNYIKDFVGEKINLYIAGCMLYWGEGTKIQNAIVFTNSDVNMVKLFIRFLEECLDVKKEKIVININCYTDFLTVEQIEKYWLSELGLTKDCLRKTMVNHISKSSKNKRVGFLKYGTCRLTVNNTSLLHQIYGGIQEIGNFSNEQWIKTNASVT